MITEFFLAMEPPTKTHQEKKIDWQRHRVYEDAELATVRAKLSDAVGRYRPEQPYTGAVRLVTKWLFTCGKHPAGTYRITKPDTDNLVKLLKDVMTKNKFWKDDAQVASEVIEKFWAEIPGIYVYIEELT